MFNGKACTSPVLNKSLTDKQNQFKLEYMMNQ